jgi:hypothetical protein
MDAAENPSFNSVARAAERVCRRALSDATSFSLAAVEDCRHRDASLGVWPSSTCAAGMIR